MVSLTTENDLKIKLDRKDTIAIMVGSLTRVEGGSSGSVDVYFCGCYGLHLK